MTCLTRWNHASVHEDTEEAQGVRDTRHPETCYER